MIACTLQHNEVFNLPTMFNMGTLCLAAKLGRILFSTSQISANMNLECNQEFSDACHLEEKFLDLNE